MHELPVSALPPLPPGLVHRRSAAEVAAVLAAHEEEWEAQTAAMLKRRDDRARYAAARKAKETPESKARKYAQSLARKVRRLMVDLDEAQRYAEALQMLEAVSFVTESAQQRADRLGELLATNLGKARALAAGGCKVSKALLLQIEG